MKILYDYQAFSIQKIGGISRYFSEIFSNLPEKFEYSLGLMYSNNLYIKKKVSHLAINYKEDYLEGYNLPGKETLKKFLKYLSPSNFPDTNYLNKKNALSLLAEQDFDIFHPTYYDPYFLNGIGSKPFVLTIHDMIHELYPEFFPANDLTSLHKRTLASKASHIIAVSENTKKDIINILGIPESKITVIYHGTNTIDLHESLNDPTPSDYLLFVGERIRYKNFLFLINSISEVLIKEQLSLICTGVPFTNEELELFQNLGIIKHMKHCFSDEASLAQLYKNAIAFIFPSTYEGFGIPVLEAFANDCPVLLSQSSCLPEIAGDAALYFDPKSKKELYERTNLLINDKQLRRSLINKGRIRLKDFSWSIASQATSNIYLKVLLERTN